MERPTKLRPGSPSRLHWPRMVGHSPQAYDTMKLPILAVLLVGLCAVAGISVAEDTGISVTGSGEATAKPNRLEIDLKANASAELTGDAVVKYRDSVRRAKEAFEKLKLERLTIGDRGL